MREKSLRFPSAGLDPTFSLIRHPPRGRSADATLPRWGKDNGASLSPTRRPRKTHKKIHGSDSVDLFHIRQLICQGFSSLLLQLRRQVCQGLGEGFLVRMTRVVGGRRSDQSSDLFLFAVSTHITALRTVRAPITPAAAYRAVCHIGVTAITVASPMFIAYVRVTE